MDSESLAGGISLIRSIGAACSRKRAFLRRYRPPFRRSAATAFHECIFCLCTTGAKASGEPAQWSAEIARDGIACADIRQSVAVRGVAWLREHAEYQTRNRDLTVRGVELRSRAGIRSPV